MRLKINSHLEEPALERREPRENRRDAVETLGVREVKRREYDGHRAENGGAQLGNLQRRSFGSVNR